MPRSRRAAILSLVVLVLLGMGPTIVTRAADPVPGLDIGATAPDLALADQGGVVRTLTKLREDGYLAIVFHRSADW